LKNDIHQKSLPDNSGKNFRWIPTVTMGVLIVLSGFVLWLSNAGRDSRPAKHENSTGNKHKSYQTEFKQNKKLIKRLIVISNQIKKPHFQLKNPAQARQIIQNLVSKCLSCFFFPSMNKRTLKTTTKDFIQCFPPADFICQKCDSIRRTN